MQNMYGLAEQNEICVLRAMQRIENEGTSMAASRVRGVFECSDVEPPWLEVPNGIPFSNSAIGDHSMGMECRHSVYFLQ